MNKSIEFIYYPFNESEDEFIDGNIDPEGGLLSGQGIMFKIVFSSDNLEISYGFTHSLIEEAANTPGHPMCLPISMEINNVTKALYSDEFAQSGYDITTLNIMGFPPGPKLISIPNDEGKEDFHTI